MLLIDSFYVATAGSAEQHNVTAPVNHSEQFVLISEDMIKLRCNNLDGTSIMLPNKLRVVLISDPETDKRCPTKQQLR